MAIFFMFCAAAVSRHCSATLARPRKRQYRNPNNSFESANPTPAMLLARRGLYEAPIDVGESVGQYKVHTGTSFINALRRDTLDRKI